MIPWLGVALESRILVQQRTVGWRHESDILLGRNARMLRRRNSDLHRSAIRLSLFDAIILAPVIALPLLLVISLALVSMVTLLIVTGAAVALTIVGDVARRIWRQTRQPVVLRRRAIG